MIRTLILVVVVVSLGACQDRSVTNAAQQGKYTTIEGETMGTYYRIKFNGQKDYKPAIDSLLTAFNNEVSTYIPGSVISMFNKSDTSQQYEPGFFIDNLLISKYFFEISNGYYDPTVMPLVNYWGFGYSSNKEVELIDSVKISAILEYVGMKKITVEQKGNTFTILKEHAKTELDFSSVAKGYGVDVLAEFLDEKNVHDYMVDIGGEMRLKGKNDRGEKWSIGINTPLEGASMSDAVRYIGLSSKGIATSGNYRNFYEKDGKKISHTINPLTGFPERSTLLSVTIITDDCAHADAWATTCMVLGIERATELLKSHPEVDACLIYNDSGKLGVKYFNNFETYLIK